MRAGGVDPDQYGRASRRAALPCLQRRSYGVASKGIVQSFNIDPDQPRWIEMLRDGTNAWIRLATMLDANAERGLIGAVSPEAQRFRLLGQLSHPSSERVMRSHWL